MAENRGGKRAAPDWVTSLIRDDEREALSALSVEDRKRLHSGEEVTASNGIIFKFHTERVEVGGATIGVVVARREGKSRHLVIERHAAIQAATAELNAELKLHKLPAELGRKLQAYFRAAHAYSESLGDLAAEINNERKRAVNLAKALPAATRSAVSSVKAAARHAGDPKAKAKKAALQLWKERNAGKHPKLRTVEQYATEVMRRWPVLTSAKVICGWSAKWSKEAREGRTPAC